MNLGAALFMIRVLVGAIFAAHGAQKLAGLERTAQLFEQVGVRPGRWWAPVAALAEAAGGVLFAFGLLTPLAALALVTVMATAVVAVHWPRGLWNSQGGYEYNLVLATVAAAMGLFGPGNYSIDARIGYPLPHPWTFVVGLVAVVLAAGIASGRLPRPQRYRVRGKQPQAA